MTTFDERLAPVISAPLTRLYDERGSLTKVFAGGTFCGADLGVDRRQILYSANHRAGVLRGLHVQLPPFGEAKLIVSLVGRTYWVVVDLRGGSLSFGQWRAFELAPDGSAGADALQVPPGFAHGCLALSDGAGVLIVADQEHAPGHGTGIAWNDPELAVDWPLAGREPVLSKEHARYGSFADFRRRYGAL
jgi:dTDP-4-dehydrorhamnose 3,5-epimerase